MGVNTSTDTKNALADTFAGRGTHGALYTTAPSGAAGTEVAGGSPAYGRLALAWGAASGGGKQTSPAPFNVPSGTTVRGAGLHQGAAGPFVDGLALTDQPFSSQGTYSVTFSYTQN